MTGKFYDIFEGFERSLFKICFDNFRNWALNKPAAQAAGADPSQ